MGNRHLIGVVMGFGFLREVARLAETNRAARLAARQLLTDAYYSKLYEQCRAVKVAGLRSFAAKSNPFLECRLIPASSIQYMHIDVCEDCNLKTLHVAIGWETYKCQDDRTRHRGCRCEVVADLTASKGYYWEWATLSTDPMMRQWDYRLISDLQRACFDPDWHV
jgi:hypothetical protein